VSAGFAAKRQEERKKERTFLFLLYSLGCYRFEVAVNDVLSAEEPQALDQRVGKSADQVEAEALVVVLLDQLVEIEAASGKETKLATKYKTT